MALQDIQADRQQAVVQAIRDHHQRLGQTMADHALTIGRIVDRLADPAETQARLVAFCSQEVLPHAAAEEGTLYATAERLPEAGLLVRSMTREHAILRDAVEALRSARTSGEVVAAAAALNALFQAHLAKENEDLLPALTAAGVDLSTLLDGMHEILGGTDAAAQPGDQCVCGGAESLDVRTLAPGDRPRGMASPHRPPMSETDFRTKGGPR